MGLFSVDPDDDGYPLTVGDYSGNAGMHINYIKLTHFAIFKRFPH